jgi:hypothetical protein
MKDAVLFRARGAASRYAYGRARKSGALLHCGEQSLTAALDAAQGAGYGPTSLQHINS